METGCKHERRWDDVNKLKSKFLGYRHAMYEYMIIATCISLMLLVYHVYIAVKKEINLGETALTVLYEIRDTIKEMK
jgi:hypothetical protein